MSQSWRMTIEVKEHRPDRADAIVKALSLEWDFTDGQINARDGWIYGYGDDTLSGEGDDEFADRVARAAWKANGGFCQVEVQATYLDDLPTEWHAFDEDAYAEMTGKAA